jgi:hypothetical protein
MKYMDDDKYFSWNDSWVITAMLWQIEEESEIDLGALIGAGDMLNHAIFIEEELKSGFYKAQKKGLISIANNKIRLLNKGKEIKNKVHNMRGGLFTIVDNMDKKLNSKRTKLVDINENTIDPCSFINKKSMKESYLKYRNQFKKNR